MLVLLIMIKTSGPQMPNPNYREGSQPISGALYCFVKFHLSVISFVDHAFHVVSKKSLSYLRSSRFFSYVIVQIFYI